METLTSVQRVAVIAIGLALTLLVAMLFLPWAWKQISELLPAAATRGVGPAPAPLPPALDPPPADAPLSVAVFAARTWSELPSPAAV